MDIHKWIMDIHNSDWIMDIHKSHNAAQSLPQCISIFSHNAMFCFDEHR